MGRVIVLLFLVFVAFVVWKAFGPSSWKKNEAPQIKGPDDDEDFLWQLDKQRFKEKRERERREEQEKRRREGGSKD